MTSASTPRPLPWLRLVIYVLILVGCGYVAGREAYFGLASNITEGTAVRLGSTGTGRGTRYWAEFEYLDTQNAPHLLLVNPSHPATMPGDVAEVQYLRHAPSVSRLKPTLLMGWSFGGVAVLAVVVFVGEIVVCRRQGEPNWVQPPNGWKPPEDEMS